MDCLKGVRESGTAGLESPADLGQGFHQVHLKQYISPLLHRSLSLLSSALTHGFLQVIASSSLPCAAYAQTGLRNQFCSSVVIVIVVDCHCKIFQTGDLEAITTGKQEGVIEIPQKINVCAPDSDQNDSYLRVSSSFLFNICISLWSI